nr:lamin tail domain-containing protein [Streptomyces sp. SID11385]
MPFSAIRGNLRNTSEHYVRIRFAAPAVLAAAALVGLATSPSQAAAHQSGVHIGLVQFDSPGKDTRSNTSLNGEWVNIHNNSKSAVQLKGYKLKDNTGYTYTFGSYKIGAGKTVKVRTGKGKNVSGTVYWNRGSYVWNNTGDKARLYTSKGALRDSCSWKTAKSGQKNCH